MRRVLVLLVTVMAVAIAACQQDTSKTWFEGDLEAARAEAGRRDTVVMIEFYTDWCNWCRRLEADTFSVPAVRSELEQIVSLRRDAEKGGADLAVRFGVDSYPTMIFLDPAGNEWEFVEYLSDDPRERNDYDLPLHGFEEVGAATLAERLAEDRTEMADVVPQRLMGVVSWRTG